MIYVCSTYTVKKADEALRQKRFEFVEKWVAEQLSWSIPVFSPIVYNHEMAIKYGMPKDWEFWQDIDCKFIDSCYKVIVLKMPYWEDSVGISAEIVYAEDKGIEIEYVDVNYTE